MDLDAKLNQQVVYAVRSGVAASGDPSFGTKTLIPARVEAREETVTDFDGTITQASHIVYSKVRIPLGARVWLPGTSAGNDNEARAVLRSSEDPSLRATQTLYTAVV